MLAGFGPFFLMMLLALGLAFTLLKAAEIFGPRRPRTSKSSPYESGMDPIGTARDRYSVKFYLVAMLFIVFDVEIVFMYPWAAAFTGFIEAGVGLYALGVAGVFTLIVLVGLLYDVKKGGLDWN